MIEPSATMDGETTLESPRIPFAETIQRLRNRSWLLRVQAFAAMGVLVLAACAIGWIFLSLQRISGGAPGDTESTAPRQSPYDYGLMETRHAAIAVKLRELSDLVTDTRQELITDKYGRGGAEQAIVLKHLQERSEELSNLKGDLEGRFAKDREDMYREILALRAERDRALASSVEKGSYIRLVGAAVMRIGVLVLAVYLIAIVSNIAKYWLRVADHLNAVADSLDLLHSAGLEVQSAIAALTPHPIDFQVDDISPPKSVKELVATLKSVGIGSSKE